MNNPLVVCPSCGGPRIDGESVKVIDYQHWAFCDALKPSFLAALTEGDMRSSLSQMSYRNQPRRLP